MEQRKPVTRTRPANEILSDLEDRLRLEGQLPAKSFTRTLELTKLSSPNEEQAIEAGNKLLQHRSFSEAAEVYTSVIASKELTEQRKRESDEKSRTRQLSEKEIGWKELMDRELERKNKLLISLNDYFTKKPKKVDLELSLELGAEIQSQARVLAAYERKREERNKVVSETLTKQITQLKELGDSPVTEYLGNDRKTWLVKSSDLKSINQEKEQEYFV